MLWRHWWNAKSLSNNCIFTQIILRTLFLRSTGCKTYFLSRGCNNLGQVYRPKCCWMHNWVCKYKTYTVATAKKIVPSSWAVYQVLKWTQIPRSTNLFAARQGENHCCRWRLTLNSTWVRAHHFINWNI